MPEGKGVKQDVREAARWLRAAADNGHAGAQGRLAILYLEGNGVVQDYVLGHMWANLGTAGGDAVAASAGPAHLADDTEQVARHRIWCGLETESARRTATIDLAMSDALALTGGTGVSSILGTARGSHWASNRWILAGLASWRASWRSQDYTSREQPIPVVYEGTRFAMGFRADLVVQGKPGVNG